MDGDGDCEGAGGAPTDRRRWTPPSGREFGPAGWLLVCVLAIGLVGAPLAILLRPPGLPFEVAFLVLPLTPAVLLGVAAVWAALRGLEWG